MSIEDHKFDDGNVIFARGFINVIAIRTDCSTIGYDRNDVNAMAKHFKQDELSILKDLVKSLPIKNVTTGSSPQYCIGWDNLKTMLTDKILYLEEE